MPRVRDTDASSCRTVRRGDHIDKRRQDDVRFALRSDTPAKVRVKAESAEDCSTEVFAVLALPRSAATALISLYFWHPRAVNDYTADAK